MYQWCGRELPNFITFMRQPYDMERRTFTKLVASGVTISIAGCTSGDGGEGGNPEGSDDSGDNAGGGNSSGEYGLPSCDSPDR